MGKKIYNGLSGVLKVIFFLLAGVSCIICNLYVFGMSFFMTDPDKFTFEPFRYAFVMLGFAGFIGLLIRGLLQIVSLFRQGKENYFLSLTLDFMMVLFGLINYKDFDFDSMAFPYYILDNLMQMSESSLDIISYACQYSFYGALIIAFIDMVVLIVSICKNRIKIFGGDNGGKIVHALVITVVPAVVICIISILGMMIHDNQQLIAANKVIEGGFDSFMMTDFNGNEYTEDMFKGHKVTMMNIWGTFCGPCKTEMPALQEIYEMYDDENLQLIGMVGDLYTVSGLDDGMVDEAIDIIDKTGVKYPVIIPSPEIQTGVIDNGGIRFYPTTIFFDENGEKVKVIEKALSKEEWIETINKVIGEVE